jgi:transcriptional/translational regulatory protein YebC/TACO1
MGAPGCVGYLFERKGLITVSAAGVEEDALMAVALDAGADDLSRQDDVYEITCEPASYQRVQEALAGAKVLVTSAEMPMLAKVQVDAPDLETAMKAMRLVEALNDHDDVQNVYSNLNMSRELIAELSK